MVGPPPAFSPLSALSAALEGPLEGMAPPLVPFLPFAQAQVVAQEPPAAAPLQVAPAAAPAAPLEGFLLAPLWLKILRFPLVELNLYLL